MGICIKSFLLMIFIIGSIYAKEPINKRHVLYLMQTGKYKLALAQYQKYCHEQKQADFSLLQQLAWLILEKGAQSSDEEIQQLAMFGAGQAQGVRSFDILTKGLNSSNPKTQLIALHFLAALQDDSIDDFLIKAMGSAFLMTRLEAAFEMAKRRHRCALGQIESLMYRLPSFMKPFFPQLIAMVGTKEAMQFLRSFFNDKDIFVRLEALHQICEQGRDDFLDIIRQRVKYPNIAEQEACCYALGKLNDSSSKKLLEQMSKSHAENVRLASYLSLYRLGDSSVLSKIVSLASKGNLFAIYNLAFLDNTEQFLQDLLQSPEELVQLNAALALLEKKDPSCLCVLKKWLLTEDFNLAIRPIFSMGHVLKAWQFLTSPMARKENSAYSLSNLYALKIHIAKKIRNLPEQDFCDFAQDVFLQQQKDLIPTVTELLENINSEKTVALLEEFAQYKSSALVRDYCHLALYRMQKKKDHEKYIETWLLHQSKHETISLTSSEPSQQRFDGNNFFLQPEEKSRLLIEMFHAFAMRQDAKSIEVLVQALKNCHKKNQYVLAGLLIKAIE